MGAKIGVVTRKNSTKKKPTFEGLEAGNRAKFVTNHPVYVYSEKLQGCLFSANRSA